MLKFLAFLVISLPIACLGQYTITGRVLDAADKKPVADASVFLNNAIAGAKSADNGNFTITNVRPGQYDLVVSIVGYETFHETVMVTADISLPPIEISVKAIQLKEVRIGPNRNWDRDYQIFKRLFLGMSENADRCKILNPDVLDFDNDRKTGIFSATSSDFLIIENKALGYKIRYLLSSLTMENNTGMSYFEGTAAFEELPGSKSQLQRWQKNRLNAYEGSSMHFLRAAISDTSTIEKEGFRVFRMIRKPNPEYPGSANKYITKLVASPALSVTDFIKLTDVKGEFAMGFEDCLYVVYGKKLARTNANAKLPAAGDTPEYLNSTATTLVIFDSPYAYFDNNGIVINPRSLIYDGSWGKSLVADLLPVDYVP